MRAVEQMLTERGYDLANPVVTEGEDPFPDFLAVAGTLEKVGVLVHSIDGSRADLP